MSRLIRLAAVVLLGALLNDSAEPQTSRREASRLGVDVVRLKVGGEVRGIILQRSADGSQVGLAVRRDWLAQHNPRLLNALPPEDDEAERETYRALVRRIDRWLDELPAASPNSPEPAAVPLGANPQSADQQQEELLRVLQAERAVYQEYVDDPLKLPAGEGSPQARRQAYRTLVRRLDGWIAELQAPRAAAVAGGDQDAGDDRNELIRILESERETYQKLVDGPDPRAGRGESEYIRVTLSRAEVLVVYAQPPARRQLALIALQHRVPDVESLTVSDLQSRLTDLDVDADNVTIDPSGLLDDVQPQNDREWAARRALYEYQFLKRLDFQGTGNYVVQTGEDAPPPNLSELIQGIVDQQTSNALGDLLDEPIFTGLDFGGLGVKKPTNGWMTKATRTADKLGIRGLRVTRMTPDVRRRETLVEDRFLAKMPDGTWETIWTVRKTQLARDADQSDLDRIKQDPQLKEVLKLVEGLGLGQGGQLDLALQFGAATMNAQQATDDAFYEFRDKYSQQLAGPPLSWK